MFMHPASIADETTARAANLSFVFIEFPPMQPFNIEATRWAP
jgi:hypothetical protein